MGVEGSLLDTISDFYTESRECNGYPLSRLGHSEPRLRSLVTQAVERLVAEGKITLVFRSQGNPHVKRFPDRPVSEQLERLQAEGLESACAYPSAPVIQAAMDVEQFDKRPFSKRLWLGEPQLLPLFFFDLKVLEPYFAEPRYICGGAIRTPDTYWYELPEEDRIHLETYGHAKNAGGDWAVAAFLWDLHELPPKHQQHWNSHAASGDYTADPDWLIPNLEGHMSPGISVYTAILEEQEVIVKMCRLIQRPPLFRNSYRWERRPEAFCPLLRPTRRNFFNFVQDLDKLLSDNLNRDFFRGEVELEEEISREDGRVEVRQKGTLRLLAEFLDKWVQNTAPQAAGDTDVTEMLKPLKEVRQIRNDTSHRLLDDAHDREFWPKQEHLVRRVYAALKEIRCLLALDPRAAACDVPDRLREGRITVF